MRPTSRCEIEKSTIRNTMKAEAMTKWEIDVPISSQLPESLTRKKKFRVIMSVIDRTSRKSEKVGRSSSCASTPNTADSKKYGILCLKISNAPIAKG